MRFFQEIRIPKDIIIYGAGNIGKCFYEKVKDICNIRCFVVTAVYDFQNIYEDIISKNVNARIISLQEILA